MSKKQSFQWGNQVLRSCMVSMLVLALLLPVTGAHAGSTGGETELATFLRCDPATPDTGIVGVSDVVVNMYIQDVVNLYGADLVVSDFDSTIAQVVDQSPDDGVQIQPLNAFLQPNQVYINAASNTAGWIRFMVFQTNPRPPVTGSGPIAQITFSGQRAGTFEMTWGTSELSTRDGFLIPFTAQPCTITFTDPLAVTLASFDATAQADHVLVAWETVSEIDNAGFNLYRSETPDGQRTLLNDALIPSYNPGGTSGAAYSWQDFAVRPDQTYYYWLEDVTLAGMTTLHGPVSAAYAGPTAVMLDGVSASPAAGMASLPWLWVVAGAGAALAASRRRT